MRDVRYAFPTGLCLGLFVAVSVTLSSGPSTDLPEDGGATCELSQLEVGMSMTQVRALCGADYMPVMFQAFPPREEDFFYAWRGHLWWKTKLVVGFEDYKVHHFYLTDSDGKELP